MKTFRAMVFCFAASTARAQETPVDPYSPPALSSGRLILSTRNREAAQATNACATALEAGEPTRAKEKCEEALKHDPQVALTHLHMAQALAELGDNAGAHAELSRAGELSAHASHGEKLFIDAYRARRDAKIDDAERLYDELCNTLPGEPRARLARGEFLLARGQIDRAIADFHSIPAIAPRFGVVDRFLAKALTASAPSAAEEAVAVAKRYAAAAPTEASAEVAVGYAELRRGNAAEAIAAAKRALEKDAKNISAELLLIRSGGHSIYAAAAI